MKLVIFTKKFLIKNNTIIKYEIGNFHKIISDKNTLKKITL